MCWSSSRWFWSCSWRARAGSRARLLGKREGENPAEIALRMCFEAVVVCARVLCEGHDPVEVGRILDGVDAGGREHDGVELKFPSVAGPVVGDQALAVQVEGVERELLVG